MRAFAKALGTSSGRLSEFMTGKRRLSLETALRFARNLGLNSELRSTLKIRYENESAASNFSIRTYHIFEPISLDDFSKISEWHYFAILSYLDLESSDQSESNIAEQLGISSTDVKKTIEVLNKLQLIEKNGNGWGRKIENLTTLGSIPPSQLNILHRQLIGKVWNELSDMAVERRDMEVERRDISSMVMAIDSSKLAEAKKKIRQFRRSLSKFLENGKRDSVYTLNLQLVPLSISNEKK